MRDIVIADAQLLPEVARMESEIFHTERSVGALEMFCGEGSVCAACTEGERLLGYCTVLFVLDEAQIIDLATDPEHRRRGIAREIMDFVLSLCAERKIRTVSLEVRRSNGAAIGLYTSLGFEVAGVRRGFYSSPREDAIVMIKELVTE